MSDSQILSIILEELTLDQFRQLRDQSSNWTTSLQTAMFERLLRTFGDKFYRALNKGSYNSKTVIDALLTLEQENPNEFDRVIAEGDASAFLKSGFELPMEMLLEITKNNQYSEIVALCGTSDYLAGLCSEQSFEYIYKHKYPKVYKFLRGYDRNYDYAKALSVIEEYEKINISDSSITKSHSNIDAILVRTDELLDLTIDDFNKVLDKAFSKKMYLLLKYLYYIEPNNPAIIYFNWFSAINSDDLKWYQKIRNIFVDTAQNPMYDDIYSYVKIKSYEIGKLVLDDIRKKMEKENQDKYIDMITNFLYIIENEANLIYQYFLDTYPQNIIDYQNETLMYRAFDIGITGNFEIMEKMIQIAIEQDTDLNDTYTWMSELLTGQPDNDTGFKLLVKYRDEFPEIDEFLNNENGDLEDLIKDTDQNIRKDAAAFKYLESLL